MKLEGKININDIGKFIITERTLPKQPNEYLEVSFPAKLTCDTEAVFDNINFPFAISSVKSHKIKSLQILGKSDEKEVHEIVLENENQFKFLPGDTIGILPENDEEEVEFILKRLDLLEKADIPCKIQLKNVSAKSVKIPVHIPKQTTCRVILTNLINYKCVPKKSLICSLLNYCENETERLFLETLSSKEGNELYNDLILKKSVNVFDILKAFESLHPPLSLLIEHLPRLLPRPYSISNSFLNNPKEMKIIFSSFIDNRGITTKYLKKIYNVNSTKIVNLYFRQPSKFRFVEEYYSKDILMISVGCAVSPFLGFLEEKSYLMEQGLEMGRWFLYCGFRCKSTAIYRSRIVNYEKNGVLEKYYECLSKEESTESEYVQDAIKKSQVEFSSLALSNNSILFICADGNLISKDIRACIQKCVFPDIDESDSKDIILDWIKSGKYIEEIWI
ncbi:methionine synthase reductase [Condylostylus longicornis]|uniref:methionine synthase reductase n=1 Tax=Condylostylus longicornis TaxID=2530218 RepID=UPI00244E3ABF|nr:methionine synthase reductase [Condylostylus longicornis]